MGDEWSIKIFNCTQNFTFARLLVLPKFLQLLACSLSCQYRKEVKDKPSRTPYVVFVVVSHYQMPSSYIFVLTSISFRDLPLL